MTSLRHQIHSLLVNVQWSVPRLKVVMCMPQHLVPSHYTRDSRRLVRTFIYLRSIVTQEYERHRGNQYNQRGLKAVTRLL
jgi:hypothetical protein